MKFLKRLTTIAFFTWTVLLVVILTFGTNVSSKISRGISSHVNEKRVALRDVIVQTADYYPIETSTYLSYQTDPANDEDYGLIFTSLTPEVFSVGEKNALVTGLRKDNDTNTGILQITSTKYPEFKKEISLTFKKTYPTDFRIDVYPQVEDEVKKAYLGVPLYVNCILDLDGVVTEKEVTFNYDEAYFKATEISKNYYKLVPYYDSYTYGDDFTPVEAKISYSVNGVKKEQVLTINPSLNPAELSSVYFVDNGGVAYDNQTNFFVGDPLNLVLCVDGEASRKVYYTLASSNNSVLRIDSANNIRLVGAGSANLKVTIPNGLEYTLPLEVRNHIALPSIVGAEFNDQGAISLKAEERKKIQIKANGTYQEMKISFASEAIEYDDSEFAEFGYLYFKGNQGNQGSLTIVVDDGFEKKTKTYKIVVEANELAPTEVAKTINTAFHKGAGHLAFFMLEAFLAFWFLFFYPITTKWLRYSAFAILGFFLAGITEFIQYFMPGRSALVQDVLIDYAGYILGLVCAVALFGLIKLYQVISAKAEIKKPLTNRQRIMRLTIVALLAALTVVLSFIPIRVGTVEMTLAIIPLAIGTIIYGPITGLVIGAVFGITSFAQCFGYSPFGATLLSIDPLLTFMMCVPTRMLAGFIPGLIHLALKRYKKLVIFSEALACLLVPLLNTLFFMGTLIIGFYQTEYIQGFVAFLKAPNPFVFVILFVGINGLIELLVGAFVSFPIVKALKIAFREK